MWEEDFDDQPKVLNWKRDDRELESVVSAQLVSYDANIAFRRDRENVLRFTYDIQPSMLRVKLISAEVSYDLNVNFSAEHLIDGTRNRVVQLAEQSREQAFQDWYEKRRFLEDEVIEKCGDFSIDTEESHFATDAPLLRLIERLYSSHPGLSLILAEDYQRLEYLESLEQQIFQEKVAALRSLRAETRYRYAKIVRVARGKLKGGPPIGLIPTELLQREELEIIAPHLRDLIATLPRTRSPFLQRTDYIGRMEKLQSS